MSRQRYAYYNENDEYAAQWLRNLIEARLIADGEVDSRSITDVLPSDIAHFRQCHFFAGIGGWSAALRMAGWDDDRSVWTGSCPCQPFSSAGKGEGFDDERHLWPDWYWLIGQRQPDVIFGEQVEKAIKYNWLDLVQTDLEEIGYAFAPTDIPAASVGSPQIRQRINFVAFRVGDTNDSRLERQRDRHRTSEGRERTFRSVTETSEPCGLVDADGGNAESERIQRSGQHRQFPADCRTSQDERPGPTNGFWRDADWLKCRDGKWRSVEPGTFPLAHGVSERMGRLRAYGNAIVPQASAEIIKTFMEYRP